MRAVSMPATEDPLGQSGASNGTRGTQTDPAARENVTFKYLEACCEGECPQTDCSDLSLSGEPTCPSSPVRSLAYPCGKAPPCASPAGGAAPPMCVAYKLQAAAGVQPPALKQGDRSAGGVEGGAMQMQPSGHGGPSRQTCTRVDCPGSQERTGLLAADQPSTSGMCQRSKSSMKNDSRKINCPAVEKALGAAYSSNRGPLCPFENTGVCPEGQGGGAYVSGTPMVISQTCTKVTCPASNQQATQTSALETCDKSTCPIPPPYVLAPLTGELSAHGPSGAPSSASLRSHQGAQSCEKATCPAASQQIEPSVAGLTLQVPSGAPSSSALGSRQGAQSCEKATCPAASQQIEPSVAGLSAQVPSGAPSSSALGSRHEAQSCEKATCPAASQQIEPSVAGLSLHVPSGAPSVHTSVHSLQPGAVAGALSASASCGPGPGIGPFGGRHGGCPADQGLRPQARRPEKGYRCSGSTTCHKMNPNLLPMSPIAQMYLDMSKAKHDWGDDPFRGDSVKGEEPPSSAENEGCGQCTVKDECSNQGRNKITLTFAKNIHPVIDVSLMNADGGEDEGQQCSNGAAADSRTCCSKRKCCNLC